jgi:hypothetical protein
MTPHRDPAWTIKSMPVAEREQAAAAAQRQDRSQGEWIAMAIRTQLQLESGALAPSDGAVIPPVIPVIRPVTPLAVAELETLARVCSLLAEAAGKPVPQSVTRLMWRRVRERLGGGMTKSLPGLTVGIPSPVPVAVPGPPAGDQADQQHGEGEQ